MDDDEDGGVDDVDDTIVEDDELGILEDVDELMITGGGTEMPPVLDTPLKCQYSLPSLLTTVTETPFNTCPSSSSNPAAHVMVTCERFVAFGQTRTRSSKGFLGTYRVNVF